MWSMDVKTAKKRRRVECTPKRGTDGKNVKEPESIEDLATHSRKIAEVRDWLSQAIGRSKILLLTGPAGCGKTVTLKIVAKSLGLEFQEWINPMDKLEFDFKDILDDTYDRGVYTEPNQAEKFESFIFRSSRYSTLFASRSKSLILIEDFPNYIIRNPNQLRDLLCIYKNKSQCPIAFICTDDDKMNLSLNLFPPDVKWNLGISHIKFNPVSHTALMKVLKRCSPALSNDSLENLARSSNGDIRAALTSLQFSSVGDVAAGTVAKDVTTEYFKALGRILYPKRLEERSSSGTEFLYDVQTIADQCSGAYLSMLHENYLDTFSEVKDVIRGSEVFAECDILSCGGSELSPYVSLVGAGGLMCVNKKPKKGSFKPLVKSRFTRLDSESSNLKMYPQFVYTRRVLNLDIIPFAKLLPRYSTQISSFDLDRFPSLGKRLNQPDVFKKPLPPEPVITEDTADLLIEEFED